MWTHYTLLRNARSKQRSAHLRLATQVRAQILPHAEGALRRFSETARSKSRSRAPPAALRGVRHVAGGWGKAPQPPARAWGGRSWASRPSRCAVAARALTPIHSGSAPQAPARASGAFFKQRAGQGVGAAPAPQGTRTRPLDATGATQACRQGVGGALPPAPLPLGRPRQGRRKALWKACGAGGTPCLGFKGRAAPWACAANKKTLCRRRAFPALRASLLALQAAPKGA